MSQPTLENQEIIIGLLKEVLNRLPDKKKWEDFKNKRRKEIEGSKYEKYLEYNGEGCGVNVEFKNGKKKCYKSKYEFRTKFNLSETVFKNLITYLKLLRNKEASTEQQEYIAKIFKKNDFVDVRINKNLWKDTDEWKIAHGFLPLPNNTLTENLSKGLDKGNGKKKKKKNKGKKNKNK